MTVRLVAVGALAVVAVAGMTVVQNLGGTDERGRPRPIIPGVPTGPVANAAELLNRAANVSAARPFAPRPDQWIYVEYKRRFPAVGTRLKRPGTPLVDFTEQTWWRADGGRSGAEQEGRYGDGKLRIENGPAGWKHHYPTLAELPTDPAKLPAAIAAADFPSSREDVNKLPPAKRAEALYSIYASILQNGVAPPKVEAAIFRAIAQLPGVTRELKRGMKELGGQPVIAVVRVQEGYLHSEILLDPGTYRYLGQRLVAIKDHTDHATDGTWWTKKGAVILLETRSESRIVDKAGQRG